MQAHWEDEKTESCISNLFLVLMYYIVFSAVLDVMLSCFKGRDTTILIKSLYDDKICESKRHCYIGKVVHVTPNKIQEICGGALPHQVQRPFN